MNSKNKAVQNAIQLEKVHMSRAADILSLCGVKSREELSEKDRESYDSHVSIAKEYTDLIDKAGPNARRQSKPMQPGNGQPGGEGRASSGTSSLDNAGFDSFGQYIQAISRAARGQGFDSRLEGLTMSAAAMGGSSGVTGGYAVPEAFSEMLLMPDAEPTRLCDLVAQGPMAGDVLRMPAYSDANHESSSPYGLDWAPVAENAAIGETEPTMRMVEYKPTKHGAMAYLSNEFVNDSTPAAQTALERIFVQSLRAYLDGKIIRGTGVGEPQGLLKSPALVTAAKESGQAADTIVFENILQMYGQLLTGSEGSAIWLANKTCLKQLGQLNLSVGTGGAPLLVFNAGSNFPMTLMGRPLIFSEYCSKLGDVGDIILLDPSKYFIAMRSAIRIDVSPHVRFGFDQMAYRILVRLDGKSTMNSAITPAFGGETQSGVVALAAR